MAEIIKASVSISKTLFDQAEKLAQQLDVSQSRLVELALETFIADYAGQPPADEAKLETQDGEGRVVINQGDVYWVQLEDASRTEPGIRHPYVVLQDNVFNHSRIPTVVVCALTSNIRRTNLPGTVLLDAGEANLPKQSLVETSKVSSVEKARLGDYIGTLSEERVNQILAGLRFLQQSFFDR